MNLEFCHVKVIFRMNSSCVLNVDVTALILKDPEVVCHTDRNRNLETRS